jgi:DNA-binding NarL/FixJ family response regulator
VVIAETAFGEEAVELVAHYQPDLLILDYYLRDKMDGQQVHRELRRRGLQTKVLVLTSYCNSASFFSWIERADGPDGALPKTTTLYQLRTAIVQILTTDERYIPASLWDEERGRAGNPLHKLAPHEMRVLREVAAGYQLIDVARHHHLSVSTVRSYMNDIYCKLDLPRHTIQAAGAAYYRWTATGGDESERVPPE